MILTSASAAALDAADPVAAAREHFILPPGVIYLDGNSLGALPRATPARLADVAVQEWGEGLIGSWNAADWIGAPARIGAKIAPLIGANPREVIAADSTSVNLFKLIAGALAMRPDRRVVLSEPGNFPTDLYMIEGLARMGLAELRLAPEEIAASIDEQVALVVLSHVHYKTGAVHDMAAITAAAQAKGAMVLWDLSHSAGAIPVMLNHCNADLAVGCGYKYLCGGPGAPAFAYVAERHIAAFANPLSGWMGHAAPFAFADGYAPAPGIERLLCGTPAILGLAALEVGVETIAAIGITALDAKRAALTEAFAQSVLALGAGHGLERVGPRDPAQRGSQIAFRHSEAWAINRALIARGVIGDFRAPDILRFGFAPAYVGYGNALIAAQTLAEILATKAWDCPEFRERLAVT